MPEVSSTNCRASKCARNASNRSSASSTGVAVSATAYRSTSRSTSLNSGLLSKSANALSLVSEIPAFLPTAEPMSIQNGHPIIVAALISASATIALSTVCMASCAISIPPKAAGSRG
jgi:hypothetical protein